MSRMAPEVLRNVVDVYAFISSLSVYADVSVRGIDETAPLKTLTSKELEKANAIDSSGQTTALTYGEMYGRFEGIMRTSCRRSDAKPSFEYSAWLDSWPIRSHGSLHLLGGKGR